MVRVKVRVRVRVWVRVDLGEVVLLAEHAE